MSPRMMTAGTFLASYLPEGSHFDPLQFYYLGVGPRVDGSYEEEYQRIAAQLADAGRRVTRVGITLDSVYADPGSPCYRGADLEEFAIGNVASMTLEGLLMVPNVSKWTEDLELPLPAAVRFLSYVRKGGLLLTHLSFSESELHALHLFLMKRAKPENVVRLENPLFGPAFVVRKE